MRNYLPSQGTSDQPSISIPGLVHLNDEFDWLETTDTATSTASAYRSFIYAHQNITAPEEIHVQSFSRSLYRSLFRKPMRVSASFVSPAKVLTDAVIQTIRTLKDEKIKQQTRQILELLDDNIRAFGNLPIPAFYITESDDESVLIEWIAQPFRLSFNIEKDIKESGYVLISDKYAGEIRSFGRLEGLNLDTLIKSLLILVFGNIKVENV